MHLKTFFNFKKVHFPLVRFASTVNPETLDYFSTKFGEDWWNDPQTAGLRAYNRVRIPLVRDSLLNGLLVKSFKPLEGFKVVDIGCGGGLACEPLARLGAQVSGVDPATNLIKMAKQHLNQFSPDILGHLEYINSSVEEFVTDKTKNSFDAVLSSEVVEHVDNLEDFIKNCIELVKPGGYLIFTTINQTLASRIGSIWFAENIIGSIPKGTHQYELLVPPNSLKIFLERNGTKVKLIQGIIYNPINQKMYWSRCTWMNYALVAKKD